MDSATCREYELDPEGLRTNPGRIQTEEAVGRRQILEERQNRRVLNGFVQTSGSQLSRGSEREADRARGRGLEWGTMSHCGRML